MTLTRAQPVLDTDVAIAYLRGFSAVTRFLEKTLGDWLMSVVSVAELYSGVRDGEEEIALEDFLRAFTLIPLDALSPWSRWTGIPREKQSLSEGDISRAMGWAWPMR